MKCIKISKSNEDIRNRMIDIIRDAGFTQFRKVTCEEVRNSVAQRRGFHHSDASIKRFLARCNRRWFMGEMENVSDPELTGRSVFYSFGAKQFNYGHIGSYSGELVTTITKSCHYSNWDGKILLTREDLLK